MSHQAESGRSETIRAILFKEGDVYVAQCLEFDICAQGRDIPSLLARLDLTVEAEFETCRRLGRLPSDVISPAPDHYYDLWTRRAIELRRKNSEAPAGQRIEAALAA